MVEDDEVFIAIRNGSLNAYFQGCSLAKVTFEQGDVCAYTHYKYLLRAIEGPYIKAKSGVFQHPDAWNDPKAIFANGLDDLGTLKAAAKVYSRNTEREFVSKAVQGVGNVFDVEIAFSVPPTSDEDDAATPRVDLAALERTSDGIQLVLYEAKLFENPELRSRGDQVPVLGQIAQYEGVLNDHYDAVRAAYLNAGRLLVAIDGLPPERKAWAQQLVDQEKIFSVCRQARLIIGKFDHDQKHGKAWKPHRDKLERYLGASRILAAKEPRTIADKISRAAE